MWVLSHLDRLHADLRYTIRPLRSDELVECKALHKEWFPIEYSDQFFNSIPNAIQALAAVIDVADYDERGEGSVIIGLILYRTEKADSNYLRATFWFSSSPAVYIVTIGVVTPLRRHGIAQQLLQELQTASAVARPVYIYLHVAAYNASGIRFYEGAGFSRQEVLRDHYWIEGRRYDAYAYVLYMFGGKPPLLTFDNLAWLFCQVGRGDK
jgi:ribosomal protein S18 acetylase RimI-like enzyme